MRIRNASTGANGQDVACPFEDLKIVANTNSVITSLHHPYGLFYKPLYLRHRNARNFRGREIFDGINGEKLLSSHPGRKKWCSSDPFQVFTILPCALAYVSPFSSLRYLTYASVIMCSCISTMSFNNLYCLQSIVSSAVCLQMY